MLLESREEREPMGFILSLGNVYRYYYCHWCPCLQILKSRDLELVPLVNDKVIQVMNVNIQILHSAEQALGHP